LGWNLNVFSLLSFFASVVCIYLGIFAFRLDTKSKSNKVFLFLCISFAIWAFAYAFVYSAPNKDVLWFWFKASSIGWCTFGGIALHFCLILAKKERILKKPWIYPLLYLPGIVFIYRAWTGIITAKDFVQTGLGWVGTGAPESIWFWLYIVNCAACIVTGLFLVWFWGRKSDLKREKKQANIIIYAASITFVLGSLTNILLPVLHIQVIPAIASILILIWALGIYHAITGYNLMQATPQVAADEILSRMTDLLILTDCETKITKVNSQVENLLQYDYKELFGKPINLIILEENIVNNAVSTIKENTYLFYNHDVTCTTKYGEHIPVNISCSAIRDKFNEIIGIVFVGQNTRQAHQLYEEIIIRKRVEDALMMSQAELEMRVEERTAELARVNEELQNDILDRRLAARLLKESEESYRTLSENLPCTVYRVYLNENNRMEFFNNMLKIMTGYEKEELITGEICSIDQLIFNEDRMHVIKSVKNALLMKEPFQVEYRLIHKNGNVLNFMERGRPVYDADGFPIYIDGVIFDITEKHKTIEELKDSERKLTDIIDYMPDAAFVINSEGIVIAWNKAMEEMTGIKAKNIIGKGNYEYALPFYGARRPIMIDLALSPDNKEIERRYPFVKIENETFYTELFVSGFGKEGSYLWAKARPLYSSSGRVEAAIEIIRDVTKRRYMEEALKTEKERFEALSDNSPFGLILLDKNGIFQYINPGFKEIFGYNLDDIPDGRTWFRKAYPDKFYRQEVAGEWITNFKNAAIGEKQSKIFKTICKDGTERIIDFVSVHLESGEFLITCVDITKLKKLEDELREMSLTDDLTGLYNRRGFLALGKQQLKMAERMQKDMMLVYMDVDNMKWINDSLGHHEGDKALMYVASILRETFRESDIIARIGGDEFVVLAIESGENHAEVFSARLQETMDDHNNTIKHVYRLSMSIGITQYTSDTPGDLDNLLKIADELMYKNKRDKQTVQ
jgi:diguanylate cyclase (GGDEF)-like protein/PAS domain S-box-containing protein